VPIVTGRMAARHRGRNVNRPANPAKMETTRKLILLNRFLEGRGGKSEGGRGVVGKKEETVSDAC